MYGYECVCVCINITLHKFINMHVLSCQFSFKIYNGYEINKYSTNH